MNARHASLKPWLRTCLIRLIEASLQAYRYGVGVFKMDWALDGPIPWRSPEVARAATVHLGGTYAEIGAAEAAVARGEHPERPFILLAQSSLFDSSRAPAGGHTVWAYCHVPNGSRVDMSGRLEAQIERFAPGFRDRILALQRVHRARSEQYNPNYIGGDINGGIQDWRQFWTRPVARMVPTRPPIPLFTSARRPRRPAAACMACAATTRPGWLSHAGVSNAVNP